MINDYDTDVAQLHILQLLSSQDAAAWIAYKSSDTAATAAACKFQLHLFLDIQILLFFLCIK